jgi:hypothetical protein
MVYELIVVFNAIGLAFDDHTGARSGCSLTSSALPVDQVLEIRNILGSSGSNRAIHWQPRAVHAAVMAWRTPQF